MRRWKGGLGMIERSILFTLLLVGFCSFAYAQSDLLLFGGDRHDVFLGCLTCSEYDSDSVHNRYGDHGSQYSSTSIFNPYGDYGSKYSSDSACNPYASDPPVIVDADGNFYGTLTMNRYHPDVTSSSTVLDWLESVCPD